MTTVRDYLEARARFEVAQKELKEAMTERDRSYAEYKKRSDKRYNHFALFTLFILFSPFIFVLIGVVFYK